MKRLFLISIIFSATAMLHMNAQPSFKMGLVLDDEDYLQAPAISPNIQVDLGQKSIPVELDLSPYAPEVRNQGDISSCVGWSAGYAAMTIEQALSQGWADKDLITENAHSAMFVYNQLTDGDCQGVRMPKALKLMQEKGNCLAREYDIDINDCGLEVPDELVDRAQQYRIEDYIRLFDPKVESSQKIEQVKLVLAQQKPVIVGMRVLNNFYNIQPGDQSWLPTVGDQTYAGGHAMVVVGYDDYKFNRGEGLSNPEMRGAFKLMNSWGKNWGKKGFIWIRYAHFGAFCRHAYALMLAGGDPIDFDLDMTPAEVVEGAPLRKFSGNFAFQTYTGQWFNDEPYFEPQQVSLNQHAYQLTNRRVGDQFQLKVSTAFDRGYIYVFSIDPEQKAEIHFPRSQDYDPKFAQNESAILMTGGSALTIPTMNTALKLARPGQDHLIVLFSERKIKPRYLHQLSRKLAQHPEPIAKAIPKLLGKHMIPYADINYHSSGMGFEVSTRSTGKIVPLILTVESRPTD